MQYRILAMRGGLWDASVTVVDVEYPNRTLTIIVPTHEVLTEETLGKLVREGDERDAELVKNLDLVFQAQRTGQVLST